ncbi:hypothetical protein BH11PSE14_BH11PSE14_13600 [soil metagenome]
MHLKDGSIQATVAGRLPARIRTLARNGRRVLSAFLVSALFWAVPVAAQPIGTSAALQDAACAGDRGNGTLGCTAGEFTVQAAVQEATGTLPTCTIGGSAEIDIRVHLLGSNTQRNDAAFFIGQTGNAPRIQGSGLCSVATFPTTPAPFLVGDGDVCGDFAGNGDAFLDVTAVKVACQFGTDPNLPDYGLLKLPYTLTYWQGNGAVCTGPAYDPILFPNGATSGTKSKCNTGTGTVSGVNLQGFVDITKQTVPDLDPTLFTFNTTGTAPFDPVTDGTFQLSDGQTHRVETVVNTVTKTITITEASTVGWNSAAVITCVDYLGAPVGSTVTIDGANRTFTASLDLAHPAVACTINNTKGVPLSVSKSWVNGKIGDTATLTTTGAAANLNYLSTVDVGTEVDSATPIIVTSGNVITLAETIGAGASVNYTSALQCTGNVTPLNGNILTIGPTDTGVTCTWTNTRKSATLNVAKSWSNAVVADAVDISTTGGINNVSFQAVSTQPTQIQADPTTYAVFSGEVLTFAELFTQGLPGDYVTSLGCTGTGASLAGNVLTVGPTATAITCTYTNSRSPVNLTIRKSWVNAKINDAVTVSTVGGINSASLPSTANTPTEIDTAVTPIQVFAGEQIIIGETFNTGDPNTYNSSLACTGNATPVSGAQLTVTAGDTNIVCTETNSRKGATLTLAKSWVNGAVGSSVTVNGTGAINVLTLNSVATGGNQTTTGSPINVFVGEQISLAEVFNSSDQANYSSGLACTGNGTVLAGNVLTVNAADTAITCTFTNTRASGSLTLAKTWVNANIGETAALSGSGGANAASLNSTAGAANETDTGLPVTVSAGEQITLTELIGGGNGGNYVKALACTGGTLNGNVLTIGATPGSITCTFTNTRAAGTLTLAKTWVNAHIGDTAAVTGTGGANPASLNSTANTAGETDTSGQFTVSTGEVITISETIGAGAGVNYNSSLGCTGLGNGTTLVGNVLTIGASPGAITCTETNSRKSATLVLTKSWTNAAVNDAVTVNGNSTETGAHSLASIANTATEIDTGSSYQVFAGEAIAFSENFTTGSQANYTSSLACSGNGTALAGSSLTINPADTAISCGYTNARIGSSLTVRKTWVNAVVNDAVSVTTTGAANNANLASVADTANETDAGTPVNVFAGEAITISEAFTTGSSANYTSSLACTGNTTPLAGSVLTVTAGDEGIVCTETNTRRGATLTLRKTWVTALVGDAVRVITAGATNNASLSSTADTTGETDSGTPVNVFAGEAITITEAFTNGSAQAYNAVLSCTGNTTPLAANVLTINAADTAVVCTETNTRIAFPILNVTKTATPTTFIIGQPAAYNITVTNGGSAATNGNFTIADNLPTGITLVSATGANWSCTGTTSLSCTYSGTLAAGASTTLTLNVAVGNTATTGNNSATATGGGDATCPAAGHCTGTVQVPIQAPGPSLSIVKSANPVRVNAGSLVLYTLTITNIVNYDVTDAQVRDMPPNGLAYVVGSGRIYDANSANNAVTGARPIVFSGVDVAHGQTIRIQYLLRAGAALAAGEYTNYAQAFRLGQPISNIASFTVYAETGADPLLEQTRILGKVFDDKNGNGWQDDGERGVPGVRIAGVNGLVSETDAYGRYHQEGIVLPNQERGMNYVLKLDKATLPPGASITTENPLIRRITAAIPARFDFGVKLPAQAPMAASSEDVDLGEINFTPGSTEIRPEYQGVLDRIANDVKAHQAGEVFIDSATGNSPLAFERAGKVRDQIVERLSAEERANFTITVRLQAKDGTTGEMGVSDEVSLGQVFFDTDKSTIRPEFESLLDSIAARIEAVGSGRVNIVGHADLRASTEYNQALGLRRANSVYDAIAKRLSPEARTKLSVEVEGAAQAPGAGQ